MWIAQDKDGSIYTYEGKPEPRSYGFYHDTVIDQIQDGDGLRDNWQSSLINLETHDYKIEDGILIKVDKNKRHKHADLIHAWAEGAVVQFWMGRVWCDVEPSWEKDREYRIKPKTKTIRFRNYLAYKDEVYVSFDDSDINGFVQWIGDWQEVEVTE